MKPILVAIPESVEWRQVLSDGLIKESFSTVHAFSPEDAKNIIEKSPLLAVIFKSSWAFHESSQTDIVKLTRGIIPAVTLIERETLVAYGQNRVFDKVFNPTDFQEFCIIPFTMEELLLHLRIAISHQNETRKMSPQQLGK